MKNPGKAYFVPFILTGAIIILDQITKAFIVAIRPEPGPKPIKDVFNNGLLMIYHVRNKAIAFSLGNNIPQEFRLVLFVIVPVAVLALLVWYYFRAEDFNRLQRFALAGIIGGGLGNIIDRIFRKDGVVDFVSVKFYGLFGLDRWPTFNVADASVVICCFILLFSLMKPEKPEAQ